MTIVKSLNKKKLDISDLEADLPIVQNVGYPHRIHRSKKWRKSVPFINRKNFPYKRKRVKIISKNFIKIT